MPNRHNVTEITEFPAIDEFIKYCKSFNITKTYSRGETVLDPSSNTKYLHIVSEGYLKTFDITEKGEERIVTIMGENFMFPFTWVFNTDSIDFHFYSETMSEAKVILAPLAEVHKFISTRPDILMELLNLASKRIINLFGYNEYVASASLEDKLLHVIYFLGLRFGQKKNPVALLPFRLSHHDLACMVGASREATTLNFNKLVKKQVIEKINGQFCIYLNNIDHSKFPKIYNYRTY